ncbi:ABC transporter permease [Balneatrix alpica]|uniref:Arginine ABC transporter permease protein ArtM n=1 Tax=Balneatrix alpica TaxID=75684 RepID=A0ABV5Z9I9_9GAMM|nr:ABC transporter permease [Balneatrix alpica]
MDFSIIWANWPLYLEGLWTTVQLVVLALLIGLAIALPMALMRQSSNPVLKGLAWSYIYFFRGTPLLVQMFIIYYGFGQLAWIKSTWMWIFLQEAYFCALLAFTLNTAAYTAEIIRGAIATTPHGEVEAAIAYGMSRWQRMRRIILPSAARRALHAYSNEIIFMLHGSSVASVITLVDLTGAARIVNSRYYSPFEAFIASGVLYLLMTFLIVWGIKLAEKRWHAHLRPRTH